tara:strand:+ start:297 stop:1118 length:822 start_codon:yes stop_codon:yes gene_type:complete
MDSDKSVTANFVKKKYTLTTSVEGEGTVTEKVIKAGTATDYNSGTIVELTAVPSSEWEFKEWTGDLTGTENPKQITIDKAKTVKAVFEQPAFYIDENGVTIKARDWVTVGTKEELGGVTYIAVDNNTLKSMVQNNDDLSKAVTTLVTDMSWLLFQNYIQNPDISSWDVSNVTTMRRMFYGANLFNQNIGSWDVSKVVNMSDMFSFAETFNQDIGSWDVSKVSSMGQMFRRTLEFNQDLTKWCVTYITKEPGNFSKDSALKWWNKPNWGTCPSD